MKKLVLIAGSFPEVKDGMGDYCYNLARSLRKTLPGVELHVITTKNPSLLSLDDLKLHPLVDNWGLEALPKIMSRIAGIGPDLVHIQYPSINFRRSLMPNLLPLALSLGGKRPVVVTLHGFGLYALAGKLRLALSCIGADAVVPVSEHIRQTLLEFLPTLRVGEAIGRKLSGPIFIASSVFPQRREEKRRKDNYKGRRRKAGPKALCHFGFINDGKGFDDLLKALALCRDRGLDFRLTAIAELNPGRDSYHAYIRGLIDSLDLGSRVRFTGYIPEPKVAGLLAASDLGVFPFNYGASTKRGSLLAALACGLPSITTGDPTLPSFFEDGRNIVLVPVRDPEALAGAILKVASNEAALGGLRRGAEELAKHFRWEDIAAKHAELYYRLLGRAEDRCLNPTGAGKR